MCETPRFSLSTEKHTNKHIHTHTITHTWNNWLRADHLEYIAASDKDPGKKQLADVACIQLKVNQSDLFMYIWKYVSAFKQKNKSVYQHAKEISQKELGGFVSLYSVNISLYPPKIIIIKNLPGSEYKMQCILALALFPDFSILFGKLKNKIFLSLI